MAYPDTLDTLPTFADGSSRLDTTPAAVLTAAEMTAITTAVAAIQAELGLIPSAAFASVAARLDAITAAATATDGAVSALTTTVADKAPLASPALTGNPTAPTQAPGNNSTRIATTAFVETRVSTIRGGTA